MVYLDRIEEKYKGLTRQQKGSGWILIITLWPHKFRVYPLQQ